MKTLLLCKQNKDGKMIEKSVPENLAATYLKIGWKVKEEKKTYSKSINIKDEEK